MDTTTPAKVTKFVRTGLQISFVLMFVLSAFGAAPAYAQDGTGGEEGSGVEGAGQALVDVIFAITRVFIKILVFSGVAIFAASMARGAFSAQLANLVGSPLGMSQAWMNIIGGIFTFLIAVFSPLIVDLVFNIVVGFVDTTFAIPSF